MTYYQSATIEKMEGQITTLVRKVAMDKQDEKELKEKLELTIRQEIEEELKLAKSKKSKKSKTLAGE